MAADEGQGKATGANASGTKDNASRTDDRPDAGRAADPMTKEETSAEAQAEAKAASGEKSGTASAAEATAQKTADKPADKPAAKPAAKAPPKKEEKPWPYPARYKEPKVTEDLDALKARFGGVITHIGDMSGKPVAYVDPLHALDVLTHCRHDLMFDHLSFVSACDYVDEGILEMHWQLYSYGTGRHLAVKAHIPRDDARIASVVGLWRGADWHEREAWDLLGIRFEGHPDLRRIFMPEGWRGHPLRKDYDRTPQYIGMNEKGEDVVYDTPGPYRW